MYEAALKQKSKATKPVLCLVDSSFQKIKSMSQPVIPFVLRFLKFAMTITNPGDPAFCNRENQ